MTPVVLLHPDSPCRDCGGPTDRPRLSTRCLRCWSARKAQKVTDRNYRKRAGGIADRMLYSASVMRREGTW